MMRMGVVLRIECRMRNLLTTRARTLQLLQKATLRQRIHAPPSLLPLQQQVLSGQRDQIEHQQSEVMMTVYQTDTTRPHLPVIENMTTEEVEAVEKRGATIEKERVNEVESSPSRTQIAADLLEEEVEAAARGQGLLGIAIGIEIAKGIRIGVETGIGIGTGMVIGIEVETETGIGVETGTGIESIEAEDDCKIRI